MDLLPFFKYFSINGKLPELNDLNEASKITEIAENLFNEYKNNKDWKYRRIWWKNCKQNY